MESGTKVKSDSATCGVSPNDNARPKMVSRMYPVRCVGVGAEKPESGAWSICGTSAAFPGVVSYSISTRHLNAPMLQCGNAMTMFVPSNEPEPMQLSSET